MKYIKVFLSWYTDRFGTGLPGKLTAEDQASKGNYTMVNNVMWQDGRIFCRVQKGEKITAWAPFCSHLSYVI